MKTTVLCMAVLCSILLSGSAPSPVQIPSLQQELADLARRSITHRFIDPTTIELKEEWSGPDVDEELAGAKRSRDSLVGCCAGNPDTGN